MSNCGALEHHLTAFYMWATVSYSWRMGSGMASQINWKLKLNMPLALGICIILFSNGSISVVQF